MYRYLSLRVMAGAIFLLVTSFLVVSTASGAPAGSYSLALRRYPYLTDVSGSYATLNWGTDRSESSGGVRYGKVGSESCAAHYVAGTRTAISVNGVSQYQWKAQLDLQPGTQYCYRVYLGTSPATEIDLLGSDSSPTFWTQVPSGANGSFSFVVFGDWGQVDSSGNNPYQTDLMALMASSGARFALTTGDNGYPSGNQQNFGDLIQTGPDMSAIFGPSFWKIPGASLPIFPALGNHGYYSSLANHPALTTWPQDRAVAASGGRYLTETSCCLNGSTSRTYPSAWYAFDAGPARFYVLHTAWQESNSGTASEYEMDYDYHWAPGTDQYEWLQADLAAHPSVLKFAFFHYPLYSDNPHEATDTFLLGSEGLEGLLKQNGVDIAFTGHAHIYERNLASPEGVINYITGGGGATPGTLGTCTALDAYAIKFTSTGKACGSAPVPTSAGQVYHFLKVTVNGSSVTVTPINSLGQSFDVQNYSFTSGAETTSPSTPANLTATALSGTQVNLSWSASSDDTGVRGYGIYERGTLIAVVDQDTLTYSNVNLSPSTNYSYRVDAFDGSGNHSALSSSRSATTQGTGTYTFMPVADAYVAESTTTTNYGTLTTLKADASPANRSYLRFNVEGLSDTVTQATLRLHTSSSSSSGYQVRGVIGQNWEEGTITYTNSPAVGSVIGSSGSFAAGSWTSVDVTSLITGNGIHDLALTTTTTTTLNFQSRDAGSNQPQLVIETSASGGGTATPSPTSTPTATATAGSGNILMFTTVADARVVQTSPTTNYGTSTNLQADGGTGSAQTSYIRFNPSGIIGTLENVKLRVFCTTNGTSNGPAAYLADSSWIESGAGGITWNTQPTLLSGAVDNKGAIGTSSWVEYDVTSFVAADGTYTFALVADGTDGVTFSSREGATPPQLEVTLAASTPTASVTSTPSGTASQTNTPTPTLTLTSSPVATNTSTFTSTPTGLPTMTGTPTFTPTPTNPSIATDTPTFTPTPTNLPAETDTPTSTPTPTDLPAATDTPIFTPTSTDSPATDTPTLTPTSTDSPTATATSTFTPTPTNLPTATGTSTFTLTPTNLPTATGTPTLSPAPTTTLASSITITYTTEADTRISQNSPSTNYGSQSNLLINGADGAAQTGLIRFTVSGVAGSVQNVKLRVFCTGNGTSDGPAAYLAENDWIEKGTGGVTWNTQPNLLSGAFDNKGALETNTWVEYDVTALISGDGMYTFALLGDGTDGVTFSSREGTASSQLVVTFGP
jgi:hypothetical protein